jgi:hypothetical protein
VTYDASAVKSILKTSDLLLVTVMVVLETLAAATEEVELSLIVRQLLILAGQLVLVVQHAVVSFIRSARATVTRDTHDQLLLYLE